MEYAGLRDYRDLDRLTPQDDIFKRLKSALKNVSVITRIPRGMTRGRRIKELILRAGSYEFDKDGQQTTVQVRRAPSACADRASC